MDVRKHHAGPLDRVPAAPSVSRHSTGGMLGLALAVCIVTACAKPLAEPPPPRPSAAAPSAPAPSGPAPSAPAGERPGSPRDSTRVRSPREVVVRVARAHLGAPYVWGGSSPSGFDCSGFVKYVYSRIGVALPHGAVAQYKHGTAIPRTGLKPGDLVFFDRLRHNGIYVGDGLFVHATQSGDVVRLSRLDEEWFRTRWVGARRLLSGA